MLLTIFSFLFITACNNDDGDATQPVEVAFNSLTANGSTLASTTMLILTFDKDIPDLTADDITLTGATKGELTGKGSGMYELVLSVITATSEITVIVSKTGYNIAPASREVTVYKSRDIYVAGVMRNEAERDIAVLWKNGIVTPLADNISKAQSVCVSSTDVYVAD